MPKDLINTVRQIQTMADLALEANDPKGANLKQRSLGDLDRIANSAWLNLYEYLSEKGIAPEKHFKIGTED